MSRVATLNEEQAYFKQKLHETQTHAYSLCQSEPSCS